MRKIIALDVYGTMLATEDIPFARKGLEESLIRCKESDLILCTSSDAKIQDVKEDLQKTGIDLKYFDEFFQMPREGKEFFNLPKDFTPIINHYKISPQGLWVYGDRKIRDTAPAIKLGCNATLVPEYYDEHSNTDIGIYFEEMFRKWK